MLGGIQFRLALVSLASVAVACTFGDDGTAPEPLGLGEQPQVDGEVPSLDEPLDPLGDEGGDGGGGDGGPADDPGGDGGSADMGDDGNEGGDGSADGSADDGGGDGADGGADDGPGDDPDPNDGGTEVDCSQPYSEIYWAENADLAEPMDFATAPTSTEGLLVAYSTVAEQGLVAFDVTLPCAGEYAVHGLVWDTAPGAAAGLDPDSFFVDVGSGDEFVWRYGCQTLGMTTALSWQSLSSLFQQPCNAAGVTVVAPDAGTYTITLRNREPGSESTVAAIAALSVSTDLGHDPYAVYDPYE